MCFYFHYTTKAQISRKSESCIKFSVELLILKAGVLSNLLTSNSTLLLNSIIYAFTRNTTDKRSQCAVLCCLAIGTESILIWYWNACVMHIELAPGAPMINSCLLITELTKNQHL